MVGVSLVKKNEIMLLKDLNVILNFAIIVSDVSTETAINANDIVSTLQALGMLKYWKGKHLILRRQVWSKNKIYFPLPLSFKKY